MATGRRDSVDRGAGVRRWSGCGPPRLLGFTGSLVKVAFATVLEEAGRQLGAFLPRLLGALVLLLVGILVARLVARLLRRLLHSAGLDKLAERWGLHDALERVGLPRSLSEVLAVATRIGLTLVFIFAALSLLGLVFLSQSLNEAVLFLPKLLAVGALLLAGVVLSGLARERIDASTDQMDLPVPLGLFAQVTVMAVFIITAAAQIAVSSAILLLLVAVVLGAVLGSLALAFGLGGRDVARALSAGRIIAGSLEIGQRIEVEELSGEIVGFDPAVTLLKTSEGVIRVPNHLLISKPVLVLGGDGTEASAVPVETPSDG